MRNIFTVAVLAIGLISAGHASADPPDSDIIDLGGDTETQRRCPGLTINAESFFQEYMDIARSVGANKNIPYFSCGPKCKEYESWLTKKDRAYDARKMDEYKRRNEGIWGLVGSKYAMRLFYGKSSPDGFKALASKLISSNARDEWNTLAGIDCNGFVSNFAQRNGWTWAHENLDPPMYARKTHIQSARDICPGDIIVYTNARHVAIVGEGAGQDNIVVNGKNIQLATFNVYESSADGSPTGLQKHVQGFGLSGSGKGEFQLYHHHQPGRTPWNQVVVVPGSGSL